VIECVVNITILLTATPNLPNQKCRYPFEFIIIIIITAIIKLRKMYVPSGKIRIIFTHKSTPSFIKRFLIHDDS